MTFRCENSPVIASHESLWSVSSIKRIPGARLAGIDLTGANLKGANLVGVDRSTANFTGCDMLHATTEGNVDFYAYLKAFNPTWEPPKT